jgi:hypothetical protein
LSKSAEARAIRLALNIEDRALADRVAALLANVPGLRLVRGNETADVARLLLLSCLCQRMAMYR